MEVLTKERMGEIALAILKQKAKGDRIPDIQELKRNIGNASKEMGISKEELFSLWITLYGEIFEGILSDANRVFEDNTTVPKQPSPLRVAGKKVLGFIGLKK